MMELAPGFRGKNSKMRKHQFHDGSSGGGGIVESDYDNTLLVIKLSDSLVLRTIGRSFLLAMVIIALPCIGPFFEGRSNFKYVDDYYESSFGSDLIDFEFLNMFFRDCADEGLIKQGDRVLVSIPGIEKIRDLEFLNESGTVDVVIMEIDKANLGSIANESFDLAFISSSHDAEFIDRIVKTEGIVAVLLGFCPSKNEFLERSNYEVLYLPRFSFTIVAMLKTGPAIKVVSSSTKRCLCTTGSQAKLVPLNGFMPKPIKIYMKKTNYLPFLLKCKRDDKKIKNKKANCECLALCRRLMGRGGFRVQQPLMASLSE